MPENGLLSINWLIKELENIGTSDTIIIATQNMDILSLTDKILWMDKGRVRVFGPTNDVKSKYIESITQ